MLSFSHEAYVSQHIRYEVAFVQVLIAITHDDANASQIFFFFTFSFKLQI